MSETWNQVKTPKLNIEYTGGWCLKAVEDAFGTQHIDPSASDDWTSEGKADHPGETPPAGIYVPVFFSLGKVPAGHVAISLPDGRVASSTLPGVHQGLYIHPSLANLINMYSLYNGGCTYHGWSEGVGDTPVVTPIADPGGGNDMTGKELAGAIYGVLGWNNANPSDDVLTDKGNLIDAQGVQGFVQVMNDVRNAPPWRQPDEVNEIVAPLQTQLDSANSNNVNLTQQLTEAQAALKAAQDANDPTQQPDCQAAVSEALSNALDRYEQNPFPLVFTWFG